MAAMAVAQFQLARGSTACRLLLLAADLGAFSVISVPRGM